MLFFLQNTRFSYFFLTHNVMFFVVPFNFRYYFSVLNWMKLRIFCVFATFVFHFYFSLFINYSLNWNLLSYTYKRIWDNLFSCVFILSSLLLFIIIIQFFSLLFLVIFFKLNGIEIYRATATNKRIRDYFFTNKECENYFWKPYALASLTRDNLNCISNSWRLTTKANVSCLKFLNKKPNMVVKSACNKYENNFNYFFFII